MHQRTRMLASVLPQLVRSVEARLGYLERLVATAAAARVGHLFEVDGDRFERIQARSNAGRGGQQGAGRVRAGGWPTARRWT